MKRTILDSEIDWEMSWGQTKEDGSRRYPDKPETEMIFEEGPALALMLINDVIFLNDHWWKKEWPEEAQNVTGLYVNCNDVFAWGCADGEEVMYEELEELYRCFRVDPMWGAAVWCMKKRKQLPQLPVYKEIMLGGIWDLDNMGLSPNTPDIDEQARYKIARKEIDKIKKMSQTNITTFDKVKETITNLIKG